MSIKDILVAICSIAAMVILANIFPASEGLGEHTGRNYDKPSRIRELEQELQRLHRQPRSNRRDRKIEDLKRRLNNQSQQR